MGKCFADRSMAIGFNPDTMALVCPLEGREDTFQVPIQGITKAELMGEFGSCNPCQSINWPSRSPWRQLEYTQNLTGTTS
jgi:hypothetical protein